jgi:hypothetical protein
MSSPSLPILFVNIVILLNLYFLLSTILAQNRLYFTRNNYSDDIFLAVKFYGQNSREIIPRVGNTVEATLRVSRKKGY